MVTTGTNPAGTIEQAVHAALATVDDPEIHRPITELGMVKSVVVVDGVADIGVYLTVAGCPMRETITTRVTDAVSRVPGVSSVRVELDVMSDEQRADMRKNLRGGAAEAVIPFAQPGSLTRVYCVASGKGGVGKSSVTVNLAAALAARGLSVGVVDADIYGHSVPRMLGVTARPTQVDDMIMPPQAHGVKVISIGMFTAGNDAVVWRGPMLHRALQQFLADVYWGDLDVLLLDLPPGTGDIAISTAQLLPNAELLVVTTPQQAAAEVAERAGSIAAADPPAGGRRRGEHVVDGAARRLAHGRLRLRRRADRGRLADPAPRREGAAARPDPAGDAGARGRRRGDAGRAHRPRVTRRDRPAGRGREARGALPRAGRDVAGPLPRPALTLAIGSRSRDRRAGGR